MYIYYVTTPDVIGNNWAVVNQNDGTAFCFVKFGITSDDNLDVIRRGYTTHNPSLGFNKIYYEDNLGDLGKSVQRAILQLHSDKIIQVGRTEWFSCLLPQALALFNKFSQWDSNGWNIDYHNYKNFIVQLQNIVRR